MKIRPIFEYIESIRRWLSIRCLQKEGTKRWIVLYKARTRKFAKFNRNVDSSYRGIIFSNNVRSNGFSSRFWNVSFEKRAQSSRQFRKPVNAKTTPSETVLLQTVNLQWRWWNTRKEREDIQNRATLLCRERRIRKNQFFEWFRTVDCPKK